MFAAIHVHVVNLHAYLHAHNGLNRLTFSHTCHCVPTPNSVLSSEIKLDFKKSGRRKGMHGSNIVLQNLDGGEREWWTILLFIPRVANPPGMGGRLPEFKSISRPGMARGWPGDANLPEFRCPECPKICFILILTLLLTVQWLDLAIGNVICSLKLPESQYINKNLPEFHLEELATLIRTVRRLITQN